MNDLELTSLETVKQPPGNFIANKPNDFLKRNFPADRNMAESYIKKMVLL